MTTPPGPTPAQRVSAIFDRVAGTYDQVGVDFFGPIAGLLVEAIAPLPGEQALDVGCGRGAVTTRVADRVRPGGRVTGIDLSPAMVQATTADLATRGYDDVTLLVADATAPGQPASSYDLVTASLVVFFLPDPAAGLRAWHDLLRPGGRAGLTTFGEQSPTWAAVDDLFRPHLPPQMLDPRTSGTSGPFSSAAATTDLVAGAGFTDVRTDEVVLPVEFADVEHWERWSRSHGQRAMWDLVPDDAVADLRERAYALLAVESGPDGSVRLEQAVRVTTGTRAP